MIDVISDLIDVNLQVSVGINHISQLLLVLEQRLQEAMPVGRALALSNICIVPSVIVGFRLINFEYLAGGSVLLREL